MNNACKRFLKALKEAKDKGLWPPNVMVVAKDPAAHAPHHRSMPPHQGCKSRLVTAAKVVRQQLSIGPPRTLGQ